MQLKMILKEKQDLFTTEHGLFRNEDGAIDLASIMVGIIVIGLIGGVIAATVFAVIPWTQDNAAKQQLDSVVAAQSAYMGLSSGVPPATPVGHAPNSYASSVQLEQANLMKQGTKYCTVSTDAGKGYAVFSKSDAGKVWTATDKNTKPVIFAGTLPTDCQFLAASTPPPADVDNDGIPDTADWDTNNDGVHDDEVVPAGYTPGGKTTGSDGTPYPTIGVVETAYVKSGATTISLRFWLDSAHSAKNVSLDIGANCVRNDGSSYADRKIAVRTANGTSGTQWMDITSCGTDRIASYVIKPLTTEAMNAGVFSNPGDATGYTFIDGFRWSEPDGYMKIGNLENTTVTDGGKNVNVVYYSADAPMGTRLTAQFKGICERINQPAYKVNKLVYAERPASGNHSIFNIPVCADGRIDSFTLQPIKSLSAVENRLDFTTGYTLNGTRTWEESANGYKLLGNLESVTLEGSNLVVRAYVPYGNNGRVINTQYELVCKAADGTTKKTNRILTYTHNTINGGAVVSNSVPGCGADTMMSYSFGKVHSLGIVDNPTDFKDVAFDRTYSWTKP